MVAVRGKGHAGETVPYHDCVLCVFYVYLYVNICVCSVCIYVC